jgi:hypothetical protein
LDYDIGMTSCSHRPFVAVSVALCLIAVVVLGEQPARASGVVTECTDAGLAEALAGGGTVTFRCRRPGPSSIVIDNAKVITAPTRISGQNAITLAGQDGIFVVRPGGWLELDGVIIAGAVSGHGGVIANHGILVVRGSAVISNTGRIVNWGWMELEDSWVVGNSIEWGTGGGIWNDGTLFIRRSLIAANKAYYSGGGVENHGYVSIEDSTFIGNEATAGGYFNGTGGGLHNARTAFITNSTFISNSASSIGGGGIATNNHIVIINSTFNGNAPNNIVNSAYGAATNTIFAGGTSENCTSFAFIGSNNLSSDASCAFTGPDNQINTHPRLGPLVYFGVGVPTYSLQPDSPAIDAGTNAGCPAADQRGFARPFGARCDIGAFERTAPFANAWHVPIFRR